MDIPYRLIGFFILLMSVVYGVTGLLYAGSGYESFDFSRDIGVDWDFLWFDEIVEGFKLLGKIISVIPQVITFNIPKIPDSVRVGLNMIFIPMLFITIMGIIAYIRELMKR